MEYDSEQKQKILDLLPITLVGNKYQKNSRISMSQDPKIPALEAGEEIIEKCPKCNVKFQSPVALNIKHTCPNPQCGCQFQYMVFD